MGGLEGGSKSHSTCVFECANVAAVGEMGRVMFYYFIILIYKSSARAPLGARAGFEQTIGGVQRRLLLPNERFRRSEPRCLGVRPQMTGRSEEGARCRPRRGERRWNGGRLCVFGASIFRSDGVCQLGTERIRRATSIEFSVAAFISDPFRSHCEEGTLLGTRSV